MSGEALSIHEQVHHKILGPLMCRLCGMDDFKKKKHLRRHLEEVHKDYPCRIDTCDEVFNTLGMRKKHEESKDHKDPLTPDLITIS
jgi:hypothetical protein